MSQKKTAGIALMIAFAGAFIAWSLARPAAVPGTIGSVVSAALALGVFLSWRLLVWDKPRNKA